jgi:hypothetical protein
MAEQVAGWGQGVRGALRALASQETKEAPSDV